MSPEDAKKKSRLPEQNVFMRSDWCDEQHSGDTIMERYTKISESCTDFRATSCPALMLAQGCRRGDHDKKHRDIRWFR